MSPLKTRMIDGRMRWASSVRTCSRPPVILSNVHRPSTNIFLSWSLQTNINPSSCLIPNLVKEKVQALCSRKKIWPKDQHFQLIYNGITTFKKLRSSNSLSEVLVIFFCFFFFYKASWLVSNGSFSTYFSLSIISSEIHPVTYLNHDSNSGPSASKYCNYLATAADSFWFLN